uniref:Bm1065 n=1 Tax=Brugia malayi TaxID=6279 RepID=A0A1I9FZJ8_BRUMA|nr:Bm1065 [Brugia malayi]
MQREEHRMVYHSSITGLIFHNANKPLGIRRRVEDFDPKQPTQVFQQK